MKFEGPSQARKKKKKKKPNKTHTQELFGTLPK